jgi:flagellar basal-body rod modification protein FlgD
MAAGTNTFLTSNDATNTAAAKAGAAGKKSTTTNAKSSIAGNFDAFLTLLTTQLKNQNPLEPLNTNDFTQQLVQFASVEQQIKSNDTLNALLTSAKTSTISNAAAFVGSRITADGSSSPRDATGASWLLNFPRAASEAVITIKDESGNVVATDRKSFEPGAQIYKWDGRNSAGLPAPDGNYKISVSARDTTGQNMSVSTEISGIVDGVDLSGAAPVLLMGNNRIPIDGVKSMRK